MDKLFERLQPLIQKIITHPGITIGISLVMALIGFLLALNLKIDTDLAELIPRSYHSVQALDKLREQVGAEHEVAVVIESPSFADNKKFAEALIPKALKLQQINGEPFFIRSEFKKNIDFLKKNALFFATDHELDQLEDYLNQKIDQVKKEANPFYFELEEEDDSKTDSLGEELNSMYDELIGSEYPISEDSTAMVVKLFPSGSQTDLTFVRNTYSSLQKLVDQMNPADYNPDKFLML